MDVRYANTTHSLHTCDDLFELEFIQKHRGCTGEMVPLWASRRSTAHALLRAYAGARTSHAFSKAVPNFSHVDS